MKKTHENFTENELENVLDNDTQTPSQENESLTEETQLQNEWCEVTDNHADKDITETSISNINISD